MKGIINSNIEDQKTKSAYLNGVAEALEANGENGEAYRALASLLEQLSGVDRFYQGVVSYTDAVGQAADGAGDLWTAQRPCARARAI